VDSDAVIFEDYWKEISQLHPVLTGFSDFKESVFYGLHFAVNLIVHQDGGRPSTWISETFDTDAGIAEFFIMPLRTNTQKQSL
jgi:hypothetical protein